MNLAFGRRIARRMPWSRAPLRRRSDTVQAWVTLTVVLLTLTGGAWTGWWTARTTYRAEMRASAWERDHLRPAPAVLLQDAPEASTAGDVPQAPAGTPAPARWDAPDGTQRTGTVLAAAGTRAGSSVTVWIDERGAVAAPPRHRSPALDASVSAVVAAAGLAFLLAGVRRLVVRRLDRGRLRSWEAEWLVVGPRWSRR